VFPERAITSQGVYSKCNRGAKIQNPGLIFRGFRVSFNHQRKLGREYESLEKSRLYADRSADFHHLGGGYRRSHRWRDCRLALHFQVLVIRFPKTGSRRLDPAWSSRFFTPRKFGDEGILNCWI